MEVADVMVSLEADGATGAVVRDAEGRLWLSDSADRIGGTGIRDYSPCQQGVDEERTLLGGRLPPGAAAAEVIDDAGRHHAAVTGHGAWVAIIGQPIDGRICPVCFRDADGRPVERPLPDTWQRVPVTDTTEPCPACGAVGWDLVAPDDESRGTRGTPGGPMEPAPIVVCRTCGHEERIGGIIRMTRSDDEDPEEVARRVEASRRRIIQRQREQLAMVDFPVYAVEGWAGEMAGAGTSNGVTDRIKVAHGVSADQPGAAVHVETSQNGIYRPGEYVLARRELQHWLFAIGADMPDDPSDAAFTLAMRAAELKRRRLTAAATRGQVVITIDGIPEPFTILRTGSRWVAVHEGSEQTITVSANDVEPDAISLRQLLDPIEALFDQ